MPDNLALPRLLLIDDEDVTRLVLKELLSALGYEVLEADAGRSGLDLLERERVDAVITDFSLPDLTGAEVARAVKAAHPRLPVILLTGWDPDEENLGAEMFDFILRKPCKLDELADTMEQALARSSEAA
jgi:two-component system cell cycle sensor histidine kinase/response regulator CckA